MLKKNVTKQGVKMKKKNNINFKRNLKYAHILSKGLPNQED